MNDGDAQRGVRARGTRHAVVSACALPASARYVLARPRSLALSRVNVAHPIGSSTRIELTCDSVNYGAVLSIAFG